MGGGRREGEKNDKEVEKEKQGKEKEKWKQNLYGQIKTSKTS